MDKLLFLYIFTIIPFAIMGIISDIKLRQIKNIVSLPFLYISILFLVFFSFSPYFGSWEWFSVVVATLLTFLALHYAFWGGGDAKVFLALSFFIISYGYAFLFVDFIINIFIFYTIGILVLIFFLTPNKKKLEVIKSINYGLQLFQLLIVFVTIKHLYVLIVGFNNYLKVSIMVGIFVALKFIFPQLKKFYTNIKNSDLRLVLNLVLFFIMVYFSEMHMVYIFFIVLVFKIFIDFASNMTEYISYSGNEEYQYHSPFLVYLFFAAIFTLLAFGNMIDIVLKFVL